MISFKQHFLKEVSNALGSQQVPRGITGIAKNIANLYLTAHDLHHKFMQTGDEEYRTQFRAINKQVTDIYNNAQQLGINKEALYKLTANYFKHLKQKYNEEHGYTSQL